MMRAAAIVLDDWKLPFYRKHLEDSGFAYEDEGPLTVDTTILRVTTDNLGRLTITLANAEAAAQRSKKNG